MGRLKSLFAPGPGELLCFNATGVANGTWQDRLAQRQKEMVVNLKRFFVAAIVALLPAVVFAQQAQSTAPINLRAGPARDFPLVASFGPGTPLSVQGCEAGYAWCDVIAPGDLRGWVYTGNIGYPYQNNVVPIIGYGPSLGFPIVTFSVGAYWGQYYRNRPWYGNQARWSQYHYRPPPPRPPSYRPPGGGHRPGPPPGGRPPPHGGPPSGGRPPNGGPPSGGRPPNGGPPSGGRPPNGGPPSGGRPPTGGAA